MIKLKINNEEWVVPERFSVQQWMDLMKWDFKEVLNHPRIVHIATGVPIEKLLLADSEAIVLAMSLIVNALELRTPCEKGIKNFEDLKFGEWVDLDVYVALGVDKHLDKCMSILGKYVKNADEALWIIEKYANWRTSVYRSYSVLFGLNEPKDVEDEKAEVQDKMSVARSWYDIIVSLSNEDILNIDRVVEQPYKKVFNFMARQKQKQLEDNAKKLQQRRQHDLSRNRRPL